MRRETNSGGTMTVGGIVVVLAIVLGTALIPAGTYHYDDAARYGHSKWLLSEYGLVRQARERAVHYAPLFELGLGITTEFLTPRSLDPYRVRHVATFVAFGLSLYLLFLLLRRAEVSVAMSALAVAGIIGIIRLGGHAAFNMKDMPGAMGYLLSSVWLWSLLKEASASGWPKKTLVTIGMVSVLPFLLRSPLILLTALLPLVLVAMMSGDRSVTPMRRVRIVVLPLLSAAVFVLVVSPSLWPWNVQEWVNPLSYFAKYPEWHEGVLFMGHWFAGDNVPWWYAFAWFPVIVQPFALAVWIGGCAMLVRKRKVVDGEASFMLGIGRMRLRMTFVRWMLGVTVLTWAAVLTLHPDLYNDERHLLFLYPLLLLTGLLGLRSLPDYWLRMTAAVLLATAVWSYAAWGRYAYVYKSPIIGTPAQGDFAGDYWGICSGEAYDATLRSMVPLSVPIVGPYMVNMAQSEMQRNGMKFAKYVITRAENVRLKSEPWAQILLIGKTGGWKKNLLSEIESGDVQLLWQRDLPSGETACALLLHHPSAVDFTKGDRP